MKVLIVEEALRTLHGHWFQYISDIVNGGREAGHEIQVAVHKDACREILERLPSRPLLRASVFGDPQKPASSVNRLKAIVRHNRSLYGDLHSIFKAGELYDTVIAPTLRIDHILAYWWFFRKYRKRGFRKLVLIFIDVVGNYSGEGSSLTFPKKARLLKYALWCYRPLLKSGQVLFVAESEGMAQHYEQLCGIKFSVVPHVTSLPSLEPYRAKVAATVQRGSKAPIVFGAFGFTRYDKGSDILQDAIKLLAHQHPRLDVNFVLQWTGDYQLPNGTWVRKDSALLDHPAVRYIPAFKASADYYEWLARTDVIILPYRKAFYRKRLSRVAIDSALAGTPFIYPEGTWIEEFAAQFGAGLSFQPENPESLAQAILETVRAHPSLKLKAQSRMTMTKRAFSAQAFFDAIESVSKPGVVH